MSTTPNIGIPLPEETANVDDEIRRLASAWLLMDSLVSALQIAVANKAALNHSHTIAQISGLVTALANKMDATKTFKVTDLTDVAGASNAAAGYILQKTSNGFGFGSPSSLLGNHQHTPTDIVGLGDLIQQYISALINSSPAALDTLSELASAIGNDPNFATTITNAIGAKLATAGGTMTGPLLLAASIAAAASLRIPHGTGPSAPVNGDLWTTTAGLLARINGVTRTFFDNVNLVKVSQAEAEAGTATTARLWAAQQVFQAIAAYLATNAPQPFTGTYTAVSLATNTPRQNTTGKPLFVVITSPGNSNNAGSISIWVGVPGSYQRVGAAIGAAANAPMHVSAIISPGEYYYWLSGTNQVNALHGTPTIMEKF